MNDKISLEHENFGKTVVKWYINFGRRFPWRRSGNLTPYHVLTTEILLQRTQAFAVAKLWNKFFKLYPSLYDLANANPRKLENIIGKLGLRKRAKILITAANFIIKEFKGIIPNDFYKLLLIPGVGPYVASATLCFGFGYPFPVVDVNVLRMFNRLMGLTNEKDVRNVLMNLIPQHSPKEFCWGMLDIAAIYCKPRQTNCKDCPIKEYCSKKPIKKEEWKVYRKRVLTNKIVLTLQKFSTKI